MAELHLSHGIRFVVSAVLVMTSAVSYATSVGREDLVSRADTIRMWKVGSPHVGDTPKAIVPTWAS